MAKANNRNGGIAAAVALRAEAYGRLATEVTFRAYIAGLEGLTVEQIETVVNRALKTCKFMPTPAEINSVVDEEGRDRRRRLARAEYLLMIHRRDYTPPKEYRRDYTPPKEYVTAEELAALNAELIQSLKTKEGIN